MISKYWWYVSILEGLVWLGLAPYLVWQQWGLYPALALLVWWSMGYVRITLTLFYKLRKFRKVMGEGYIDPTVEVALAKAEANYDDALHKWIDDGESGAPEFSEN